jgi:hypothetical protein
VGSCKSLSTLRLQAKLLSCLNLAFLFVCISFCLFVSFYTLFGHKMDTNLFWIFVPFLSRKDFWSLADPLFDPNPTSEIQVLKNLL